MIEEDVVVPMRRLRHEVERVEVVAARDLTGALDGNNHALVQRNDKQNQKSEFANRLAALAGVGQTATSQTVGAATQYGATAGNNIINAGQTAANAAIAAGNAKASSYANTGNAINQGVQNLASLYLYQQGGGFGGGQTYGGYAKATPDYLQGIY